MMVTGALYAAIVTDSFDLAPTLDVSAEPMPLEETARRSAGTEAPHAATHLVA